MFSNIEEEEANTYGFKYELEFSEKLPDKKDELWVEIGEVLDYRDKTAEDFKNNYEENIKEKAKEKVEEEKVSDEKKKERIEELIKKANNILGQIHMVFCKHPVIDVVEQNTDDEEKILDIFVRTNDGGTKLEKSDILLSYMEANKELFQPCGAREEIFKFVDLLNKEEVEKPDYGFTKDDVLKASLVLTDELDVRYKLKNFGKANLEKISKNWENIKKYLKLTAKLLGKYGFAKINIISKNALIPIAYFLMFKKLSDAFLHSEKQEDIKLKEEIIRWFVISTLKSLFGSSSDTTLRKMRKNINEGKSLSDLIEGGGVDKQAIENWVDKEKYQSRYSHLILMLITNNKFWDTCHQDHIYPRSKVADKKYLKEIAGIEENQINKFIASADSFANLQLLNKYVNISKRDENPTDWIKRQSEEFKDGMLIPKNLDYSFKNFLSFIKIRRKNIIDKLTEILKAHNGL